MKFQAPSTKLQRSSKLQASSRSDANDASLGRGLQPASTCMTQIGSVLVRTSLPVRAWKRRERRGSDPWRRTKAGPRHPPGDQPPVARCGIWSFS